MFLRETESVRDRPAIEDDFEHVMTFGGLEHLSQEYLEIIPARSLIFILCDYSMETVAFYCCMMNNHAVPLLLDRELDPQLLQNLIDIYRPQYLWVSEERLSRLKQAEPFRHVGSHAILRTGCDAPVMDSRLALLLTTSGSTGSPKLIRLSEQNVRENAVMTARAYLGHTELEDKLFATLPMNYSFCLGLMHGHWMTGAPVHITEYSLMDSRFWKSMDACRATTILGVPFTLDVMQRMHFLEKNYPFLRQVVSAGAKHSVRQVSLFANALSGKGVRYVHAYGQSEVLGPFCNSEPFYTRKPESIGVPLPGYEAEISGTGELIMKGPCVCLGYAGNREDLARGDDNRGILHTGDIVSMDSEGFLYLHGRRNRYIKITGKRVSLDEVEGLLSQAFTGESFACVGDDDDLRVFHTGNPDGGEITRFCQQRLGIPRRVVLVREIPELPRNSSGKILYRELNSYDR